MSDSGPISRIENRIYETMVAWPRIQDFRVKTYRMGLQSYVQYRLEGRVKLFVWFGPWRWKMLCDLYGKNMFSDDLTPNRIAMAMERATTRLAQSRGKFDDRVIATAQRPSTPTRNTTPQRAAGGLSVIGDDDEQ